MGDPQDIEDTRGGEATSRPSSRPPRSIPAVGSRVSLRKGHPCGSNDWLLLRLASDAALCCTGCSRVVVLDRQEFLKRMKAVLQPPSG